MWRGGTLILATALAPPAHTDPSLPLGMTLRPYFAVMCAAVNDDSYFCG